MVVIGFICGKIIALLNPDYRSVWLISERGTDARDNGYWFFKYMQENHKEINSCFVIDKSSKDYSKVEQYNTVQFKSFRHYMLLAIAQVKISTHDMGFTPDMVIYHWLNRIHLVPGKKVLLQHGIIGTDIEWYHKDQCHVDLFMTSSELEYRYVLEQFKQPDHVVKLTGLCRYDHLEQDKQKKQILIMPTWRQYLVNLTEYEFRETDYYKNYMKLLNDEDFIAWLKKHEYSVVFYPHIEMQKFIHTFHTSDPAIRIACFNSDDVQQLLIESELLITDFSSVFFDAAYMNHKIIYFQFDRSDFEGKHYKGCWFDYDIFGPICMTIEELKKQIFLFVLNYDSNSNKTYEESKRRFFQFHDKNNCQRVYDEIIDMLY